MKKPFAYFILLLLFSSSLAQFHTPCLTDEMQAVRNISSNIDPSQRPYETYLSQAHSTRSTYTIPVVVHLLQSTSTALVPDSLVHSQMVVLNRTFRKLSPDSIKTPLIFQPLAADSDIEFKLASIDPYGCPTTGINRLQTPLAIHEGGQERFMKALIQWDPHRYFNVWVVESINGGFAQGYATLPAWLANQPELDGVVITADVFGYIPNHPYLEAEVMTHEAGHWLGLYHVFQDGCTGTNSQNCSSLGDRVCDTPQSANPCYSCPSGLNSCIESPLDLPDMEANYMSYSPDSIKTMFSHGQAVRMHFFLDSIRQQIHSPANLSATGVDGTTSSGCLPVASFLSDIKTVCLGESVQFSDVSPGSPTGWNWIFQGGIPATSTLQNPLVTFPSYGSFDVGLTVSNAQGNSSTMAMAYINAISTAPPPILESFEGIPPLPPGWEARNGDALSNWVTTDLAASHGQRSIFSANWGLVGNGTGDDLLLPLVDLSGSTQARLTFDRAYRRLDNFHNDSLKIEVSTDCGSTWNIEWEATLLALSSIGGYKGDAPFVPSTSQWKSDTIDLGGYLGESEVKIRFRSIGAGGQDLYLDHIQLDGFVFTHLAPVSILEFSAQSPFSVSLDIAFQVKSQQPIAIELWDLDGRRQWQIEISHQSLDSQTIRVPASKLTHLSSGVYVLYLKTDAESVVQKVVKMN